MTTPHNQHNHTPHAGGRPPLELPDGYAIIARRQRTITRDGDEVMATCFFPAWWPDDEPLPRLYPADPHTPWSGYAPRQWRYFSTWRQAVHFCEQSPGAPRERA